MDLKKQGLDRVKNKVVKNNIMGISDKMEKKDWIDSSGRKGAPFCALLSQCGATRQGAQASPYRTGRPVVVQAHLLSLS